jgi:N-acetylglucosamine malate deacetylase 2
MKKSFLGKKLMFITAHPDDEAYLASGTIAVNREHGGESIVVCATSGERGKSHLTKPVTCEQLKKIREKELKAVMKLLQVKKLLMLNLKDGQLCNCENKLLKNLKSLIAKYHPEVLISFGADGVTGHLDHIAVGKAASVIAEQFNLPMVYMAPPPCFIKDVEGIKNRRKMGVYQDEIIYEKSNVKIKIDPELKMKALLLHASQISNQDPFENFPKGSRKQILSYEYFSMK